jgi:hypothetical protein
MFIGLLIFLSGHRHFSHTAASTTGAVRGEICAADLGLAGGHALRGAGVLHAAAGK